MSCYHNCTNDDHCTYDKLAPQIYALYNIIYMLYSFYKDLYKDIERPIISVLIWTFSSQVEGKDLRIAALEAQVLVSTSFPKKQTFSEFSRNTKKWLTGDCSQSEEHPGFDAVLPSGRQVLQP